MQQFPQQNLLSNLQENNLLTEKMIGSIAEQLGYFHLHAPPAEISSSFGDLQSIESPALDNFSYCIDVVTESTAKEALRNLQQWTIKACEEYKSIFETRKKSGSIKHCHGDLHLGNIAQIKNHMTIFDCIEFNEAFYWIDVINDLAFLNMDLIGRKEDKLAIKALNEYLAITGDYQGLQLHKFYMVYRAMVRAKVALLTDKVKQFHGFKHYLQLAKNLIKPSRPNLFIMHGLSGSGKSFISKKLSPYLQAICIRSDLERKRITKDNNADIYNQKTTEQTYSKLQDLTKLILNSGYSVIVDATF